MSEPVEIGPERPDVHRAIMVGDKKKVVQLLEEGAPVDEADELGRTSLWLACRYGEELIAEVLMERGANIFAEAKESGWTPLLCSCGAKPGHSECARKLMKRGADPNIVDKKGFTPLMYAAMAGNLTTIKHLCQKGADRNVTVVQGLIKEPTTAAGLARLSSKPEVASFLETPVSAGA